MRNTFRVRDSLMCITQTSDCNSDGSRRVGSSSNVFSVLSAPDSVEYNSILMTWAKGLCGIDCSRNQIQCPLSFLAAHRIHCRRSDEARSREREGFPQRSLQSVDKASDRIASGSSVTKPVLSSPYSWYYKHHPARDRILSSRFTQS